MTTIIFTTSFSRALKKLLNAQPEMESVVREKFNIFQQNPFDSTLRTHRLSGELKEFRSFRVTYDIRIIFEFTKSGDALFSDIGTHDDVY